MGLLYFEDPAEIKRKTEESIKEFEDEQNEIAQLKNTKDQITWENSVQRLDNAEGLFCRWLWTCELMAKVMPNPDARKEYNASISTLKQFLNKTWIRSDLYQVISHLPPSNLDKSQSRLLKTYSLQFIRNGANLTDPLLFSQITQQLTQLTVKFLSNVNEDTSHVLLTRDQLEGMNDDFVNRLNKEKDMFVVTMKYPDALPVLKLAKKEETRKIVSNTFDNRCANENLSILKEIVRLRKEMAGILGYKDYPSYVLDVKMAKNVENVENFVNKIHKKVFPLAKQDIEKLLFYKQKEKKERNEPYDGILNDWDVSYYSNILKEVEYGVDDELVRQYFPMNYVLEKMFEIYQNVLALKFVEKDEKSWHKDVKYYDVFKTNEYIGSFYLDLYPREGKYSHASAYPVVDGFVSKGTRNLAVATMVANFTQPTATKPSLLTHREVVTLFHEFGHVCHNLCAKAVYYRHTWFNVEMDFLEAPSQMLENWVWTKEVLNKISSHFETKDPLPDKLIEDMIKAKNMCNGLHYARQIFFGVFDMELHKNRDFADPQEISKLWNQLKVEWSLRPASEGTNYAAGFMHLCAGYDCGYYGYLWSEVFSADMFSRFKNEGVLSAAVGEDYRRFILEPGASDDGIALIRNYLGREPTEDAFLSNIGVDK